MRAENVMPGKLRRRQRKRRITLIALATVAAFTGIIAAPSPAFAYTLEGCSWRETTLYIDYRYVNGNFRTAFQQAVGNYSGSTHVHLVASDQSGNSYTAQNANYGATGYEGYTTTGACVFTHWHSANSQLNQYYLGGYQTVTQLKVVWEHELGHGLGLGHVTPVNRVMYTSASAAYHSGVTALTSDEISGINYLY